MNKIVKKTKDQKSAFFEVRDNTIDDEALREVWDEDVYQIDNYDFNNRWVVDVGAHIGSFTIRAAEYGARVVAVEPDPHNALALTRHAYINDLEDRVFVHQAMADMKDGFDYIWTDPATGMAHVMSDETGLKIQSVKISSLFEKYSIDDCAILKVDIEGYEYNLIEDLSLIFDKCERICFETHKLDNPKRLGDLLTTLLKTHSINAFGDWSHGGQIYARRY